MVTVDDEHGTAVVYIDQAPTTDQLAAAQGVLDSLGIDDRMAEQMLPILTRQVADEAAYQRVCEQRGVLL